MNLSQRIGSFVSLGNFLKDYLDGISRMGDESVGILRDAVIRAGTLNQWFTRKSVEQSLQAWAGNLEKEKLEEWLNPYAAELKEPHAARNVAVIMAGNIPLVGFHDFLTVLVSGNRFTGRLSSDDTELLPALADILVRINPEWEAFITFTKEKLTSFDAVIATGSNNSAHYFNYYFSKFPHIIRMNRNGIAILNGDESEGELSGLADDILLYYGLGCRNVSKLYLPAGYDVSGLFRAFQRYSDYASHHKWMNNHDYYRSVYILNQIPALDNGFVLMTENPGIASPPAVIYYEYYSNRDELLNQLIQSKEEMQVAVSNKILPFSFSLPGFAQFPGLSDYADGVDTMEFLLSLPK